jgi:hypothetical protein
MRHSLWAAALAAVFVPCGARAADLEEINRAINTGTRALRALQKPDGSWVYLNANSTPGSTALAGLALLECGAAKDDPAVVAAARYVRAASVGLRYTYSVSLAILFLDRLGDPADEALLESLSARLVAGQHETGNWSYNCPEPVLQEQRRLGELVARRLPDTSRPAPTKPGDAARSFQQRVQLLNRGAPGADGPILSRPDNSNSQFALLALWVSRRHGFPVDDALRSSDRHFRRTRTLEGGWWYGDVVGAARASTGTMTCAGLLGLAVGYGVLAERPKGKDKDKAVRDLSDDPTLQAGLRYLATAVGTPPEKRADVRGPKGRHPGAGPGAVSSVMGKSYYFLWSLERVAVALNMETIGNKDWYSWGADVLVTGQNADGTWSGSYQEGGVDTCFALLFLKKANFVKDLSKLIGRVRDPGERVLRVNAGDALTRPKDGGEARVAPEPAEEPAPARVATRPKAPPLGDAPGDKLAAALVAMAAEQQGAEIERLRDQKGAEHTEALAAAIPLLAPESRRKARSALAEREARMKLETIGRDLHDENAEIRAAAASACALKETKNKEARQFVPQLIELLTDREPVVSRAAHAALRELSGVDFGPGATAGEADRKKAVEQWQAWWKKQPH